MATVSLQEPGLVVGLFLGAPLLLFLYILYYAISLHTTSVEGVRVPRGNFWLLPLLGESISALTVPPKQFIDRQTRKYGAMFTTHIGGDPMIMTTDVDLTRWVYQQTNRLFSVLSPKATYELLGHESIFYAKGDHHLRLRKVFAGYLSTQKLVPFTPRIDKMAASIMESWKRKERVIVFDEAKMYAIHLALAQLISIDTQEYPCMDHIFAHVPGENRLEKLVYLHYDIESGMMSVPLNIPGTAYHKANKAKILFRKALKVIINERRTGDVKCNDLLEGLLSPLEDGTLLDDEQVMDNVITGVGAAEVTTTTALVWMVKWIQENPELHRELQNEMDAIKKTKANGEELTYDDIKKMNLTLWTMYETLRLRKVTGFFIARTADQDVRYKDVVIPKNWVVAMTHGYHLDPNYYPEPEKFNPYRFQTMPPAHTFTPFGASVRLCPGKEMAKIEILTFMYHMLTSFRCPHSHISNLMQSEAQLPL
uniref:Cytochrome P450 n=1 Tax=Physcomitrium patens TaxID=3218 RepID=A0A7I4CM47_PHYPA